MRTARHLNKTNRHQTEPAKCTLQEVEGTGYMLTTKTFKKKEQPQVIPPPQLPPQSEYLADEYVHNLQQQLYFLDAEIRFVQDRAGVEPNSDGPSVDAAIRRLRRAIAMYEEETNKKIKDLQEKTKQLINDQGDVDEAAAVDGLSQADHFEIDELQKQEIAFIEEVSPINLHHLQVKYYDNMGEFNGQQQDALTHEIEEQKAIRDQQEGDISNVRVNLVEDRDQRKALLQQIRNAYQSKYNALEQKDILEILAEEPDIPAPNMSLDNIKSRNAKLEMEIVSLEAAKKDAINGLGDLLEKNAKLVAEFNVLKAKAERGRSIKNNMEKKFNNDINTKKDENKKQKDLIEQLRKKKREIKAEIQQSAEECNKQFGVLNNLEAQCNLLKNLISFKKNQIEDIEKENSGTTKDIENIRVNIEDVRKNLDQLTHTIGEAEEKMKALETQVEANSKDPRCNKLNLPKELAALLENLTAVKKQIE